MTAASLEMSDEPLFDVRVEIAAHLQNQDGVCS